MYFIFKADLKIDPHQSIIYGVIVDGALNVPLAGELSKIHYPTISGMRGVEHTVSLFIKLFPKYQF